MRQIMLSKQYKSTVAAALLTSALAATASGLPDYYPSQFNGEGIVQQVSNGQLIMESRRYSIDSNVRIHTPDTEFSSLGSVPPGTEIGYSLVEKSGNGGRSINEIWVLPPGTIQLP
jgi:hypothetical protein